MAAVHGGDQWATNLIINGSGEESLAVVIETNACVFPDFETRPPVTGNDGVKSTCDSLRMHM